MKSNRLYYQNAYIIDFEATIVERIHQDGQTVVILDNSYFYPTSGGQPFDIGTINNIPVHNVSIREKDEAVLHWLDSKELWQDAVSGQVNWARRFDHMQQHSGQHILSQAFIQIAQAKTVGFHLSDNSVTIDLGTNKVSSNQIEEAEYLANQIIWQNRSIQARSVTLDQAKKLPLRKLPAVRSGKIRLIEVDKFDLTACGGTHVQQTGEIGMIKVVKLERQNNQLRVEFCCGQRALHNYRLKNSVVNQLSSELTTGSGDIVETVVRFKDEIKESRRLLKKQQTQLLHFEAQKMLSTGKKVGKTAVISHVFSSDESDPGQLRILGNHLIKNKNVIVLLGLAGAKSQLLFCRSKDAPGEMNQLLKPALQILGSAAGGGSAMMAQGGGPATDSERVQQAIDKAERLLFGQIR
ncbi:Alanyl-tRNA synthetase family protein [hydrothermal vent metagenome]|uniref:Alanyl-tRNA synthetase family protein n=1 Tax=hydrothermal vent metagenome TaxID=652676 RepID=A0A3B0UR04_9ZZZZ